MVKIDIQILQELQDNFPISEKPYRIIAGGLQISEEVWDSNQKLLDEGVIRRIGARINSSKFSFSSTLAAAVSVKPDQLEHVSEIIGRFPEATHSYLRKDVFNIWCTIIAVDEKRIESILDQIRIDLYHLKRQNYSICLYKAIIKLDACFHI